MNAKSNLAGDPAAVVSSALIVVIPMASRPGAAGTLGLSACGLGKPVNSRRDRFGRVWRF